MTKKSFAALCAATAIAVALAVVAILGQPRLETAEQHGTPVFPTLVTDVDRLKTVVVRHSGEAISLDWDAKSWRYRERGNYPADSEKVTALIVQLARMTKVEGKTKLPDRYARLDVEDPIGKGGNAQQVVLIDVNGKEIANLIVGKQQRALGGKEGATYIRIAGDPQVWLASGEVTVPASPAEWLRKDIADINEGMIMRVTVTHPNGDKVVVSKESPMGGAFAVENLPKGAQASGTFIAGDYGQILSNLALEDVAPVADVAFPKDKTTTAVVEGFDGFQVTLDLVEINNETWAKIRAAASTDSKPRQLETKPGLPTPIDLRPDWSRLMGEINARTEGWAFQLPASQVAPLKHRMADIIKKADAKT